MYGKAISTSVSEQDADQHRERGRADTRQQRDARAPHQARQQIASELVGAERMAVGERRPEPVRRVDDIRIGERQIGREHGGCHREQQHERAEDRQRIAADGKATHSGFAGRSTRRGDPRRG
jgi:hypothetical protein